LTGGELVAKAGLRVFRGGSAGGGMIGKSGHCL
jgi:hypothetical protein